MRDPETTARKLIGYAAYVRRRARHFHELDPTWWMGATRFDVAGAIEG